jgi:REP element-mobilizing transposase RayT
MVHPNHCNLIRDRVNRLKTRWGIKVYRYANVGNHLHILIRAKSRPDWQGFIRELAGSIAMIVTGARKGMPLSRGFWDHLVFTRIVSFGRDFKNVAQYVCINLWEGSGIAVRRLLSRGLRILEMSEDRLILVSANAPPGLTQLLKT